MKLENPGGNECPITRAMATVGTKWKPLLIYTIRERRARFGQIHFKLRHISRKVLTEQLRQLEEDGIVHRQEFHELLPRVEYRLTEKGLALLPILYQLVDWDRKYQQLETQFTNDPEAVTRSAG